MMDLVPDHFIEQVTNENVYVKFVSDIIGVASPRDFENAIRKTVDEFLKGFICALVSQHLSRGVLVGGTIRELQDQFSFYQVPDGHFCLRLGVPERRRAPTF